VHKLWPTRSKLPLIVAALARLTGGTLAAAIVCSRAKRQDGRAPLPDGAQPPDPTACLGIARQQSECAGQPGVPPQGMHPKKKVPAGNTGAQVWSPLMVKETEALR
jgi:hypothetical protein